MLIDKAKQIVEERQKSYDHPSKNFQNIADCWSTIVGVKVTKEQVALMMIQLKVLRENFKHNDDNILDGYGYWLCLEQMLNE